MEENKPKFDIIELEKLDREEINDIQARTGKKVLLVGTDIDKRIEMLMATIAGSKLLAGLPDDIIFAKVPDELISIETDTMSPHEFNKFVEPDLKIYNEKLSRSKPSLVMTDIMGLSNKTFADESIPTYQRVGVKDRVKDKSNTFSNSRAKERRAKQARKKNRRKK